MSSLLNEVIKETIKESVVNKITLTPQNYTELFCKVAASKGLSSPECHKLKDYVNRLDLHLQKELAKMPPRSEAELFAFLTSRLNRAVNDSENKTAPHLWVLCKILLNALQLFKNKSAKQLANVSLNTLENKLNEANLKLLKEKWQDFIANFDDSYLNDLKKFGVSKNDDLKEIVSSLLNSNIAVAKDYYAISKLLLSALKPSISTNLKNEIENIQKSLQNMPELLENNKVQRNISTLIDRRIELDQKELKTKLASLHKILNDIEVQIKSYTSHFGIEQNKDLESIRKNLEALSNKDDFKSVKTKLEGVANSINFSLKDFGKKLDSSKQAINALKEEVKNLQEQLEKTMQEASNDFLTGLYTKRALQEQLERIESDYIQKNLEYCLCFFDIDHFKNINDTYGHSAGDVILAKTGSIFQKYSRNIDILARFGGEEFVVILPLSNLESAKAYALKILTTLSAFEFIYKDTKFHITISCGIASRTQTKSYKSLMEVADNMLYEAKKAGRNCVRVFENKL